MRRPRTSKPCTTAASVTDMRQPTLHCVLATMAQHGDKWASDTLVMEFEPLAIKFSRALLPGMESTTTEDLRQTGALVMLELIQKFDWTRSSWMTFCYRWLPLKVKRLTDGAFQDRLVGIPTNRLASDRTRYRATGEAAHRLHGGVSICGRKAQASDSAEPMTDDEFLMALVPDMQQPDTAGDSLLVKQIWAAVDCLPKTDRALVCMYYGQQMTLEQMGAELGKTRQAVNVALAKAITKLRFNLGVEHDHTTHTDRAKTLRRSRSIKSATVQH